jgi:Tfp pilus assembly protein PilO
MRARGREVWIIAAVVAVVLVVAWVFLLYMPKRTTLSNLDQQITAAQTSLQTAQAEIVQLQKAKKTAPQTRAEIVRLGKMIPESQDTPSLVIELKHSSDESGVHIDTITPGTTQTGNPFGVQAVTLQVSGRYFDLEDFLYRVENYVAFRNQSFRVTGRLLAVTALTLSASTSTTSTSSTSPVLTATISIAGYLSPAPTSTAAGGG